MLTSDRRKAMGMHRLGDTPPSNGSEFSVLANPRAWVDLGRVVYAWTDVRESSVDRSWWKQSFDAARANATGDLVADGSHPPLLNDLNIPSFHLHQFEPS